jgi:acyl carrier protein
MTVQQQIIDVIATTFPNLQVARLDIEQPLEVQGIDSLDMSNLLFALEARFGRRVATSQVSLLRSVRHLVEFFDPAREAKP